MFWLPNVNKYVWCKYIRFLIFSVFRSSCVEKIEITLPRSVRAA